VSAKGQGSWSLPSRDPTAPTSTEECPTAAALLRWSSVTALVTGADTVSDELHHRSPLSHLSESPLSGFAAGYRAPATDQHGKEQFPFCRSSLLHCPADTGPSASAPAHLVTARLSHPGSVRPVGMPQLLPSTQEGHCPERSQAVKHSPESDKQTYSKPGFYFAEDRV